MTTTAIAHSNIALIKYWGKRDVTLNLPSAGSISMTLAGLETRTTVAFDETLTADAVTINGQPVHARSSSARRIARFLDRIRSRAQDPRFAHVTTQNNFPTASGLASSASGFAALAIAASHDAGLDLSPKHLSILARLGSGSAARSIHGGFVEMRAGRLDDGSDAYAREVAGPGHWDLRCIVAVCDSGAKPLGSTEAMMATTKTSPYDAAWIQSVEDALEPTRAAILARDFDTLGTLAEASCLRMHANALAADPGILYWKPATVALIHRVRQAREEGLKAFFTIDAGPHVKVFCPASEETKVKTLLRETPGVLNVLTARPGAGARVISTSVT